MADWVTTYVSLKGIGSREDLYTVDEKGVKQLDFEKIIPSPKTEEELLSKYGEKYRDYKDAEGFSVNKVEHKLDKDGKEIRPWFNWYAWNTDFWGSKGNASDTVIDNEDYIYFDTPWSSPYPILEAISKMFPGETLECMCVYETNFEKSEFIVKDGYTSFTNELTCYPHCDGFDM